MKSTALHNRYILYHLQLSGEILPEKKDQEFVNNVESLFGTIVSLQPDNLYNSFRSSMCCNAISKFNFDLWVRKDTARICVSSRHLFLDGWCKLAGC